MENLNSKQEKRFRKIESNRWIFGFSFVFVALAFFSGVSSYATSQTSKWTSDCLLTGDDHYEVREGRYGLRSVYRPCWPSRKEASFDGTANMDELTMMLSENLISLEQYEAFIERIRAYDQEVEPSAP